MSSSTWMITAAVMAAVIWSLSKGRSRRTLRGQTAPGFASPGVPTYPSTGPVWPSGDATPRGTTAHPPRVFDEAG